MSIRKSRSAKKAQLVQTLVYFEGPQVALLRSDRNMDMLAVHVERDDLRHGMFACEVSKSALRKYMAQRFDLKYAISESEHGLKHYFFDWDAMSDRTVELCVASKEEIQNDEFYPESGFFARHHTREFAAKPSRAVESQKYKIDGSWEASDFSRFYGRMSDLYAVMTLASTRLVKSIELVDIHFVQQTISHYLWRGGGSYVNFYDSVFERIQSFVPLDVGKIRYASPGYIELNGGKAQLDEIEDLMSIFEDKYDNLRLIYNQIDRALRNDGLKRAPGSTGFASPAREAYVRMLTDQLILEMGVDDPRMLRDLCGGSNLVYAKIALSFFRRGRDLYKFYAEGRVQTGEEAIRSVENA